VVEASLTLSFLYQYQYVSGSKSETIGSASPDIRLMFWIWLLHRRKCSPLSHIYHIYVLLTVAYAENFHAFFIQWHMVVIFIW